MSDEEQEQSGELRDTAADAAGVNSVGRQAAGGFLWALAGFLLLQVGGFATYTIATRVLGQTGIGVAGAALTVVFFADVLLDLGMGASVIYEQEEGQSDRVRVAFTVNTVMALLVGSIVFLSATKIDEFFGAGDPNIFRIVALLAVIKGLNQVPDALLKRDLDFRKRVRSDLTRAIGRLVITTSLLLAGVGPISMVIGVTAAEFLGGIVTWYNAKFRPGFRFDWPVAEEMLKFGAAMFGSRLLGMLWLNGDYLVVSNRYGSRSKEYGNYYTAFRLPELVLGSVYNIFANVSFPAFSRARRHGMEELRKVSLRALKYLCMYGFAMGVTMALGARDFITWWFPKFQQAIVPMEILCAVGGFAAIGFASGDIFAAIGKPRLGMYFNLVGAPVLIGGFLAVADRGIVAIAAVHAVVIVPYSMFRIEVANRLIGTTWRQSLRALRPAAVTVMGITAVALPVRLGTSAGFGSGLAIAAASIVGGLVGLSIGDRSSFIEFKGIGAKAIAKVM